MKILSQNKTAEKGSVVVEFVLGFFMVIVSALLFIDILFYSISNELALYATYAASRVMKVNPYANPAKTVNRIVKGIDNKEIQYGLFSDDEQLKAYSMLIGEYDGVINYQNIINKKLGIVSYSEMLTDENMRKECEDNPLWYLKGDGSC